MEHKIKRGTLLIASFLTLVAAGAGFATRGAAGPAWAKMGIGPGEFGSIMGAGFIGFGFVIMIGGILVEKFGYKKLLLLAVGLHLVSAAMMFMTPSLYDGWVESAGQSEATNGAIQLLWISVLIFSICAGLYEAVINPLVGQLYPENQTHYLNVLHAGWPGGLIVGGLVAAAFQNETAWVQEIPWHYALSAYSLVLVLITLMVISQQFPKSVSESGKSSFGVLFSCFASIPFLLLLVLHALIGYMELGVDSWMTRLMENLVENSVTVLIYTSVLMFVLRFFAGPIVHKINPIGLLLASSVIAVLGLLWLGTEIKSVAVIFAAATLYSFGKAFLWPTMLAVAGERYPQCGAVSMSALGAAGMISVGFVGGAMIGAQQSESMNLALEESSPETYSRYFEGTQEKFLGYDFRILNPGLQQAAMEDKLDEALVNIDGREGMSDEDKSARKELIQNNFEADSQAIKMAFNAGGRRALTLTATVPGAMVIGFLILALYYKSIGGYKVIRLDEQNGESATSVEST
ncbi:MAG: MFS transporter [Fuerstiella sp.]|nr:MFS transporter [Fuerstiella sp.]